MRPSTTLFAIMRYPSIRKPSSIPIKEDNIPAIALFRSWKAKSWSPLTTSKRWKESSTTTLITTIPSNTSGIWRSFSRTNIINSVQREIKKLHKTLERWKNSIPSPFKGQAGGFSPAPWMKHIINKNHVVQIKGFRNLHCPKKRNENF